MKRAIAIAALLLLLPAVGASGKNIDLVTLPNRDSVQLTIYNSEDITLVKETRYLSFRKGRNRLQFSWANTLIDPTSVEFRPLEHKDEIEIRDTMFPGQKPQHLVWSIDSKHEGQAKVEVSYFTSGITWNMDYVAVTNPSEEAMTFTGHVRVVNRSGEQYENAQIRLIVGNIHLVEKIADLARRRGIPMPQAGTAMEESMRLEVAGKSFSKAARHAGRRDQKKQIVKEGLSEYFMFTVEGRETIGNGWSKRMEAVRSEDMRFDILYRMRTHQYGGRPVRFFLWQNDSEHRLGESPLPDGRIRVFRKNGRDGLSYLGEQLVRYVPIKAKIEVNLGPDDLVVYETKRMKTERLNFRFNRHNHVTGWDERTRWIDGIRNDRGKPIRFELHRQWGGHVDYSSEMTTTRFDYRTAVATFDVAPHGKVLYPAVVTTHMGANASQNRIQLK
jgi:hypothetical protein